MTLYCVHINMLFNLNFIYFTDDTAVNRGFKILSDLLFISPSFQFGKIEPCSRGIFQKNSAILQTKHRKYDTKFKLILFRVCI